MRIWKANPKAAQDLEDDPSRYCWNWVGKRVEPISGE